MLMTVHVQYMSNKTNNDKFVHNRQLAANLGTKWYLVTRPRYLVLQYSGVSSGIDVNVDYSSLAQSQWAPCELEMVMYCL
jgi:hypothetical protein